jgi:hypothetical protein
MAKLKESFGKVRLSEATGTNAVPRGGVLASFARMAFMSPEDKRDGPPPSSRPKAWTDQVK